MSYGPDRGANRLPGLVPCARVFTTRNSLSAGRWTKPQTRKTCGTLTRKISAKHLLHGERAIDVTELTRRFLKRDRRRVWMLGSVCVIAWMLVVMLPWATIMPMLGKVVEHQRRSPATARPPTRISAEQHDESIRMLQIVKKGTIATFIGSIASMFVAASVHGGADQSCRAGQRCGRSTPGSGKFRTS